jgi:hypothetical protein
MKKAIMKKLDAWADNKTQKEFNNWMIKWVVVPFWILAAFVTMTIDSWPM